MSEINGWYQMALQFWLVAVVWLAIITFAIVGAYFSFTGSEGDRLLNKCQADLPRSQRCVLVAVPEDR